MKFVPDGILNIHSYVDVSSLDFWSYFVMPVKKIDIQGQFCLTKCLFVEVLESNGGKIE